MFLVCYVTSVLLGTAFLTSSGPVQASAYGWFTLVGLWHQVMHQQFSFNAVSSFFSMYQSFRDKCAYSAAGRKQASSVLLGEPPDSIHELYYCKH